MLLHLPYTLAPLLHANGFYAGCFTAILHLSILETTGAAVKVFFQEGSLKVKPPNVGPDTNLHRPIR